MNYLAHSHLSYQYPDLLVGNYIADMVSNRNLATLPTQYLRGIDLHRHIDHYTDNHAVVREATALLHPTQGKYAPVVIDMLYDYILAQNWSAICDTPMDDVIRQTYVALTEALPHIPEKVQRKVSAMINDNALHRYTTLHGLHHAFGFLSRRASFSNGFNTATEDLLLHYEAFEAGFMIFYPELQATCSVLTRKILAEA